MNHADQGATMNNKLADGCQRRQALMTLDISSMTELVSAQQRMHICVVSRIHLSSLDIEKKKKKKHKNNNNINDKRKSTISFHVNASFFAHILHAIRRGNNKVVLREWKQGACWWNLNMNGQDIHPQYCDGVEEHNNCNIVRGSAHHYHNNIDSSDSDNCCCENEKSSTEQTTTVSSMARAEVAGYRLARLAMNFYHDEYTSSNSNNNNMRRVYMPEVLYFSHDNCNQFPPPPPILLSLQSNDSSASTSSYGNDKSSTPWALISYFDNGVQHDDDGSQTLGNLNVEVDSEDNDLCTDFNVMNIISITNNNNNGEEKKRAICAVASKDMPHSTTYTSSKQNNNENKAAATIPCHHFPTTMIKIRHEFGFNEPHPRHGRVPIDECLDYAMMILHNVVMPLQTYFFMLSCSDGDETRDTHNNNELIDNYLISIGHGNTNTKHTTNQIAQPFQFHDMIVIYRQALHRLTTAHHNNHGKDGEQDTRMDFILQMLDECITALDCEWEDYSDGQPPLLSPVLCHMDLQPQNLAFGHAESNDVSSHSNTSTNGYKQTCKHTTKDYYVASVMDWEEAIFADPRFELLLMCRKVLANLEQARTLWQSYSNCIQRLDNDLHTSKNKDTKQQHQQRNVGPIEPWLRLEAVHSICTLLLQSVDLLGGGRSPWETEPDLWGKIDRERQRLVQLGWLFCDCNNNRK